MIHEDVLTEWHSWSLSLTPNKMFSTSIFILARARQATNRSGTTSVWWTWVFACVCYYSTSNVQWSRMVSINVRSSPQVTTQSCSFRELDDTSSSPAPPVDHASLRGCQSTSDHPRSSPFTCSSHTSWWAVSAQSQEISAISLRDALFHIDHIAYALLRTLRMRTFYYELWKSNAGYDCNNHLIP